MCRSRVLLAAACLLAAGAVDAWAPVAWRRARLSALPARQAGTAAGAGSGEGEGEGEGDSNKLDPAELKALVESLYEGRGKNDQQQGRLLNPADFPELLSDLPGYEVEEVVRETSGEYISIFDDPVGVNRMYGSADDPFSIASDSLRDISDAYDFSLSYLGDLVVQMGAATPVDIDIPVSSYLTGEQIYTLLQSVNSLDPSEVGLEYDTLSAREVCEQTGMTTAKLLRICSTEGLNLPFGLDSVLHASVVERILAVADDDAYAEVYGELDSASGGQGGGGQDDDEDDDDEGEGEEGGEERERLVTDEDKNIW